MWLYSGKKRYTFYVEGEKQSDIAQTKVMALTVQETKLKKPGSLEDPAWRKFGYFKLILF